MGRFHFLFFYFHSVLSRGWFIFNSLNFTLAEPKVENDYFCYIHELWGSRIDEHEGWSSRIDENDGLGFHLELRVWGSRIDGNEGLGVQDRRQ